MVVDQSEASAERHTFQMLNLGWLVGFDGGHGAGGTPAISPYFGAVVGGDGGTDVRWRPRGKSACGLLTREFQQNDKHCAQELRLR